MQTWHQLPTSCHRHKAGAAEMWGLGGEPEQSPRVSCFVPLTSISRELTYMSSSAGTSQSGGLFSIREIVRLMKFPGVLEVFIVKVLAGFPIGKSHPLPMITDVLSIG